MYGFHGGSLMWLFLLVIIGIAAFTIIQFLKNNEKVSSLESPIDILKKRYAKGELTKEEFDKMKNGL